MSRNLNNIFIFTGNMAKDIEAKYTEDGLCVTNFVVAENVYVGKGKGDTDKKTGEAKDSIAVFYKCYCYNELAEQIGNSGIEVGRQVTITGKLMPDNYTAHPLRKDFVPLQPKIEGGVLTWHKQKSSS